MDITNPKDLLIKVSEILETLQIDYLITGGMAVSIWGRPRSTFDIDIVVKLKRPDINGLFKLLKEISKNGYVSEEAAQEAIKLKTEFNFNDPDTGLKIDFWIMKEDGRSKIEMNRRIKIQIGKQDIYFISPEDLIIHKLIWFNETDSQRHLEDAQSVLKFSKNKIDSDYLNKSAIQLDVNNILDRLVHQP